MVIDIVTESEPTELLAQMVNEVAFILTEGAPEITPYVLIEIPLGNAGCISQDTTAPPVFRNEIGDIVTF